MLTCRLNTTVNGRGHHGQRGVVEPKASFSGQGSMEEWRLIHVWYSLAQQVSVQEKVQMCASECIKCLLTLHGSGAGFNLSPLAV